MKILPKNKLEIYNRISTYQKKKIWDSRPVLRLIYKRWFERIKENLILPGITFEIGSGVGAIKELLPGAITSDVAYTPYVDIILDGHQLPLKNSAVDNIIAIDTLHHLHSFDRFFSEAGRVLKPKGRIVLVDMFPSIISSFLLKFLHFEDYRSICKTKKIFYRKNYSDNMLFESFRVLKKEKHDFLVYPLSGGFNYPSFCPKQWAAVLLKIEEKFKFFNNIAAFKTTIVLSKK